MSFRLVLAVRYLAAVLLPLAVFLFFSRPLGKRADTTRGALQDEVRLHRLASEQMIASLPPPRPSVPKRLDAVAGLKVPGVTARELSRTLTGRPSVRLALRGGYWELVSFLDAAWSLPFPGRVTSLSLAPAAEGSELEGEATIEVES